MSTWRLLVELGAVLFGLGIVSHLAHRVGLSPIPLYLLAGVAFGRGGLVRLHAPEGFFSTGSEVGIVLLLLLLGLEYTAGDLVDNLRRQAPVGVLDLVINGAPGAVGALVLGWGGTAAVAMFGITAISSSGIISKVLADLGHLANRETPSVLSILVFEDLSMAVYLPVLTALLAASSALTAVRSVVIAVGTLALVLVAALRYGEKVSRVVSTGSDEVLLLRLVGLALLVAGAAESVHVSAAVGAFLLGIALSGEVADHARALLEPLRDIFAAVFFVFFGLSTDPTKLPEALPAAVVLAVLGVATKMVTGWVAGRRAGVASRGRFRAGATLVARGEFSIVIAGLVGTSAGPALAPTAAAYVLILGVVGPITARVADPLARRAAARKASRAASSKVKSPAGPTNQGSATPPRSIRDRW